MTGPSRRRAIDRWVARVAIVLAIAGSASIITGVVIALRDDGGSTTAASTTAPPTTVRPTTTSTSSTTTTTPTTTVPATTTTTPPSSAPAPLPTEPSTTNVAQTPTLPANPQFSGFGSHQVMSDPLPSGLRFADVAAAWTTATRLADLLPPADWPAARTLLPNDPYTDEQFTALFGAMERMSLLLLDATPDGNGFVLTLGALSNQPALGTSTVWCMHWYADTLAVDVVDIVEMNTYPSLFTPEQLRNDPVEDGKLRGGCR